MRIDWRSGVERLQLSKAAAFNTPSLLLGLGGRQRSAFALVLLGDDYLLGSLRLSVSVTRSLQWGGPVF